MRTGTAIFWVGLFFALGYCNKTKIDCHDWTAQECIDFLREVRNKPTK